MVDVLTAQLERNTSERSAKRVGSVKTSTLLAAEGVKRGRDDDED